MSTPVAAQGAVDLVSHLNPEQRAAVTAGDGPLLIFAGAGSGKTRVLTHRIAWLIQQGRAQPGEILAVTFTNKAAREMRVRVEQLLNLSASGIWMGTFHAIAARILRRDGTAAGIDRRFVIYDEADRLAAVKRAMAELRLDEKRYPPGGFVQAISHAKDELRSAREYAQEAGTHLEELAAQVYARYEAFLERNSALDFDDLLVRTVALFREHEDVLEKYQGRFKYVMVDEYQDTNRAQYLMVQLLAQRHRNLAVVGDDDQSIYGWRGADVRNILSFERDYPEATIVKLEQNYRSTQTILDAAYHVIKVNPNRAPKRLWTDRTGGAKVVVAQTYDEQEEAQAVAQEALRLVAQGDYRLADLAVLYRTNAQSRALEEVLLRRGIPYRLIGGPRFYERREVKDVLAYLRLTANPQDTLSFSRVINLPRRKLGEKSLAQLGVFADEHGLTPWEALDRVADMTELPAAAIRSLEGFRDLIRELRAASLERRLVEVIDLLLVRIGYRQHLEETGPDGEERWANVLELHGLASEYDGLPPGEGLQAFLEEVALMSDVDSLEDRPQGLTLITLHMVKGLEFPVVFMLGMEEGLFPHSRSLDSPTGLEEERRLAYVGMTRAKDRLYLFHAFRRHLWGNAQLNLPSRFLADLPPQLVDAPAGIPAGVPAGDGAPARAIEAARPGLPVEVTQHYRQGDTVEHRSWGRGRVLKSTLTRTDEELIVKFDKVGVKILAVSLAPITRL
ncbi:MAG TPA: UvrD-helicase domain-containing protein [Candidatus Limnocylindrales bacterium]|nr:UvrD-helicase domain-containing protein [Candidatus Limnocylindrales bacterium]